MITITDKQACCGCAACATACPKQCISMTADNEGFLYPMVDASKCVECGLCEKVCHSLHPYDERKPLQVYAAINKDETVRLKSSSGGIFHILAAETIREGGVVFGARFDKEWQVVIDYAETMEDVEAFMGSKYVQARMGTAYKDAKRFLQEGRKVLFSGTPCQVAGLRQFLRKEYDNLLAVDFVCHGTPSPKVWGVYLQTAVKRAQQLTSVEFRNKTKGWKNFSFRLSYNEADGTVSMLSLFQRNAYMKAFLSDIILRPSCYHCQAKSGRSHSDLTIADFWGISTIHPEMDDDKGTGLVFVNTEKGRHAFNLQKVTAALATYEQVKPLNPACYRSPKVHPKRKEFFRRLDSEELITLINDCTRPTHRQQARQFLSRCNGLIKRVIKRTIGGGNFEPVAPKQIIQQPFRFPSDAKVAGVRFRNKERGWKGYHMEIIVKQSDQSERCWATSDK